jgi:alanine-alpha-ketoisovalerate/valine-pyruvate aminotransferase
MKEMLNQMIKAKKRAMIKGEMRMMGIKEKHHHIQECIKMFKGIIPSTTYLVISKKEVTTRIRVVNFCEY